MQNSKISRQIAIDNAGKYSFQLTDQDLVYPGIYALSIITRVDLRPICDCDEFKELVWGNERITLLTTPDHVLNCIVTRSTVLLLDENIYYVPGDIYSSKIPDELLDNIDKIKYYYSIIKELVDRKTLFLLNKNKYGFSINNVVSVTSIGDLKEHIVEMMKNKGFSEEIIQYFIKENLSELYLREKVKK